MQAYSGFLGPKGFRKGGPHVYFGAPVFATQPHGPFGLYVSIHTEMSDTCMDNDDESTENTGESSR